MTKEGQIVGSVTEPKDGIVIEYVSSDSGFRAESFDEGSLNLVYLGPAPPLDEQRVLTVTVSM